MSRESASCTSTKSHSYATMMWDLDKKIIIRLLKHNPLQWIAESTPLLQIKGKRDWHKPFFLYINIYTDLREVSNNTRTNKKELHITMQWLLWKEKLTILKTESSFPPQRTTTHLKRIKIGDIQSVTPSVSEKPQNEVVPVKWLQALNTVYSEGWIQSSS